ncbi:Hypothetical predicted protein [Lynx pardinus]|uniref:Uncharacterized protein n=1 Tax=Lynx pardinus TaxID=191816 RepID=A0A485PT51_LYNPA|nr:Hypothetical predicted protein [Lynx pardinus]
MTARVLFPIQQSNFHSTLKETAKNFYFSLSYIPKKYGHCVSMDRVAYSFLPKTFSVNTIALFSFVVN